MKTINRNIFFLTALAFLIQGCSQINKSEGPVTETADPDEADIYSEHVRTTEYQTPEEERLDFILPPGFEVTLFASEPDITKPINMAFDEKGRLWVTQSSEYPIAAGPGGGNDRITILEDTDGDGRADKINDFANDLNIPIGIMPIKGGAIGYSIPNIYKFTDTDNDGKADKREVLFGEFGHKDTHGMVNNLIRGFDGWMHASHGFSNTSVIAGTDGDSIKMVSGNTFRFKLDGSRVEKTTDGRINPFGSDYDEMGYHYSADCHTLPIFQLVWGGNYTQWGKKKPNMGFAPTMMDYGLNSTALSGLVYYTDNQFPEEYQNSFYSGDVVTCRISRSTMKFNGSTPEATREEDFLVSKDPWFRPVDIKIGPDGAMYVADFYNRIIGHYEVPLDHPGRDRISGRIWKITYKGNGREVIDWSKASLAKVIDGLNHEVLAARMQATDELVERFGNKAIPSLEKVVRQKNTDPKQLIQGVWALYRLNALPDDVLASAINHREIAVKKHAFKVLANFKELTEEQRTFAIRGLDNQNPHVQRAAAEVLGRHPDKQSYKKLITMASQIPDFDTHLRYTVLLSIKNHLEQETIMRQVAREKWNAKDADLVALVASDVKSEIAGSFLFQHLKTSDQPKDQIISYMQSIARTIPESGLEQVINYAKRKTASDLDLQYKVAMAINQGMIQRGSKTTRSSREWNVQLATKFLKNMPDETETWNPEVIAQQKYAAEVAARYKVTSLAPSLKKLVSYRAVDEDLRAEAASALMNINPELHAAFISEVISSSEESPKMRDMFASALGQSELPKIRALLGESLKGAPHRVQVTIASILANNTEGKTQLMKFIRKGYAPARLLKARKVEEALLSNITPKQRQEYNELTANVQPVSEERQELIKKRLAGFDPQGKTVEMGEAIFLKNCSMCHQVDNKGGLIGPQLDGIGNWGRHALTTKILDPNRNITENFRNYNINLKNGKSISGLYRRDEGQMLVLASATGEEFIINKQDIKEKVASKYTLMPDNFSSTIEKDDFDALMVYLLSLK
jgi:putative heme-binding domain-containing protein